ncbi:VWA domain-containing protein [uncultured Lutibacter sp.]|uniref:VWA domain-containing protein n=1 Tax=uncultured Lutibacter sp. TaxID=437739 RepID=UPI00262C7601|nr:VWA domain-containing protein [uncultured Lutibacter sp.]
MIKTMFIVLAVLLALIVAFFQYLYKNKEKSQLKYWLSFLRFLSVFTILLLLINPSINKTEIENVKPNLIVAVDNSKSIKYSSGDKSVLNFVEKLKNDKLLNDKYKVEYFSFGNNVSPLDSLKFNENQTNISAPIQEFSKLYKKSNNPIIIVTDGNQTIGNNVEFNTSKSPVFPLIIGDTTQFEDVFIGQLNVNKYTYINNKLPVEVFINYTGNKRITKQFSVYNKNNKVFSKNLIFSKDDNVKIESFFLSPKEKGIQYFTASIENLEDELNTLNNKKNFSVNVIEETSKILVLTSIIHPDLGMLKKAIESNKQRSVFIENINNFKGNVSDYQLVILYQPTSLFKSVMRNISDKNLNYFVITGLSTDWNFLNSIQQNFKKSNTSQFENYRPVYNSNFPSFLVEDIDFLNFPPIEDVFGTVNFSIPINTLLFQKIGPITTEETMLGTFQNDNQRGAFLFGENIWRWRMRSFVKNNSFEVFDGFISNVIQYLSSNLRNERLSVTVNNLFYANEMVNFSASYLDENYQFNTKSKLWVSISSKENNYIKKIPFSLSNNQYKAEFSNIPAGEYYYTVTVDNQASKSSGSFKVLQFEIEQQFKNANDLSLKKLATKTNGEVFYEQNSENLITLLQSDPRFKSVQSSKVIESPLIDWKWLLGIVVLILSIEWFIRKYFGKI